MKYFEMLPIKFIEINFHCDIINNPYRPFWEIQLNKSND